MMGPGKYDDLATLVREQAQAAAVVVLIVGGNRGAGFSVQMQAGTPGDVADGTEALADALEAMVKQMRLDAQRYRRGEVAP